MMFGEKIKLYLRLKEEMNWLGKTFMLTAYILIGVYGAIWVGKSIINNKVFTKSEDKI